MKLEKLLAFDPLERMMQLNIKLNPAREMPSNWIASLSLVYKPLIGLNGMLVYQTLYSIAQYRKHTDLHELLALTSLSKSSFTKARIRLEQYELLRSFVDSQGNLARIDLQPVMRARRFIEHDLFGRMLFMQIGADGLKNLQKLFDLHDEKEEDLKEVTRSMDRTGIEEDWTDEQEQMLKAGLLDWHNPGQYDFNWGLFFKDMQNAIPTRLRSRENLTRIAYLANVYGLDEEAMRKIVIRHIKDRRTRIDFDGVVNQLGFTKQIRETDPNDYTQAPVSFLKARQPKNSEVLPKERALLMKLSQEHEFSNELINTIVEYAMEQCQGALVEKYVETLANNMARTGIETRDQAIEYFTRSSKTASKKKKSKPSLPDWYETVPEDKATDTDLQEVLRLQQQILKGGSRDG